MDRHRLRLSLAHLLLAAVPAAVLAVFFLLPVGGMVAHVDRAGWALLGDDRTRRVVWFTVWMSTLATALSVALGLPCAYVTHRLRFPGRGLLRALLLVPFVLPTVVVGVAIGRLVDNGPFAILLGLVFFNVSVVVRTVGVAWESLDRRPAEAAAALGASSARVFRTVTLPALRPALVSAAVVVFLFCATGFGVILTLGGLRYSSVETEIYLLTTGGITGFPELSAAAALSLVQLAVVVVLLAIAARLRATPDPTVRRLPATPARPRLRDVPVLGVTAAVLVALAIPLVSLALGSVRHDGRWTLAFYRSLQSDGGGLVRVPITEALGNSLRIGLEASALSLTLGVLVAVVVTRRSRSVAERRVRAVFDGLFMVPLGVSAVTLGFGFLITLDRPPVDLRESPWLVPIAQALVALPLVVRILVPVLAGIDDRQRQAAASLGAGPLRAVLVVDVPVLWRPLLASAGFAFAVSLGEFGATSFLVRPETPTLPVVIYRLVGSPGQLNYGAAMAASVILAATAAAVVLVVERLRVPGVGSL
ncbi:MAG TPA: ABC transporter permease subunit [Nocardioides sp.]|nr:ABC transporter permease subunit [Nocardioides sp.]